MNAERSVWFCSCAIFFYFIFFSYQISAGEISSNIVKASKEDESAYLSELIQKAQTMRLYEDPVWRILIHYKPNSLSSGFTSQVTDPTFFMSKKGKIDPQEELKATLAAFFSHDLIPSVSLSPQCRFVARFYWLNQRLDFDPQRLSIESCPKYESFKQALNVASITVVFPSTHPNSPASMYGHTSMLLDKKKQTPETRMLSYTVNYAARANEENAAKYAILGLVGGFRGDFNIVPYYSKQREWSQLENRDIWEYKLNLTEDQIDFITLHTYELSTTYFDYYFFKENCSYHLLSLLEVAMPKAGLTDAFTGWTIPVDTIRELDKRGLITQVSYHPSLSTIIENKRTILTESENSLALLLANDGLAAHADELKNISVERQAKILDLTSEYLRYRKIVGSETYMVSLNSKEREILLARSKLQITSEPSTIKIPETRPDQGHGTARASAGFGSRHHDPFIELGWRATYHDLLDPADGYVAQTQLEFFNLRSRYYRDIDKLEIHSLKLVDIISLEPSDKFFKNFSWHINTGWLSIPKPDSESYSNYYTVDGGGGLAHTMNSKKSTMVYGFIDSQINYGKLFQNDYSIQAGATIGLLSQVIPSWKVHVYASKLSGIAGDRSKISKFSLEQGINVAKNLSLRLSASRLRMLNQYSTEAIAQIYLYY